MNDKRKKIRFAKSPQHKTLTIFKEGIGYISHINLKELKDFLDDEYTDIIELRNDWEEYFKDKEDKE
jgi:hypothetical protein